MAYRTFDNPAAGVRVIAGDNREVLRDMIRRSERFDLILGSPPYNLGNSTSAREHPNSSKGSAFPSGIDYDIYRDAMPEPEYQEQQIQTLDLLAQVLQPNGSLFYIHTDRIVDGETIDPADWIKQTQRLKIHQRITWDQRRTVAHNAGHCSITNEWVFWLTLRHWYGEIDHAIANRGSVWPIVIPTRPKPKPGERRHPCPFPLELAERIILLASKPGDRILDPWHGEGTTGAGAQRAARIYTGIDVSEAYCADSFRRLASYQPPLFAPAPMLPGMEV